MGNTRIPTESRKLVQKRDLWMCARCRGRGSQWHHRRSRRVVDPHRHCPCNGLWLCATCHSWAHAHPEQSMATGTIVSQWCELPWMVPVRRTDGWWMLRCEGFGVPIGDAEVVMDDGQPVLSRDVYARLRIVDL